MSKDKQNKEDPKNINFRERVLRFFSEENIFFKILPQIMRLIAILGTVLGSIKLSLDFYISQSYKQNAFEFYKIPEEYFAIDSSKNLLLIFLYLILLAFIGSPVIVKNIYPMEKEGVITKFTNLFLLLTSVFLLWLFDIGAIRSFCSNQNSPRWICWILGKCGWVTRAVVAFFCFMTIWGLCNLEQLRPKKVSFFIFLISCLISGGISVVYFFSANEFIIQPSHKIYYETFVDPEYGNMAVISKISDQTKLIAVNYEIKDGSPNTLYTSKYIVLPAEGKFFKQKKIGPNPKIK
ncbi:hypothetical protein [Treponema socranskii]|uniref:hypothetical protein n=1 Tax=Treponema socranskii TaxID=53419 RepID=UPI0028EE11F6|nr:hypothetical protein [Treponema socranskii]